MDTDGTYHLNELKILLLKPLPSQHTKHEDQALARLISRYYYPDCALLMCLLITQQLKVAHSSSYRQASSMVYWIRHQNGINSHLSSKGSINVIPMTRPCMCRNRSVLVICSVLSPNLMCRPQFLLHKIEGDMIANYLHFVACTVQQLLNLVKWSRLNSWQKGKYMWDLFNSTSSLFLAKTWGTTSNANAKKKKIANQLAKFWKGHTDLMVLQEHVLKLLNTARHSSQPLFCENPCLIPFQFGALVLLDSIWKSNNLIWRSEERRVGKECA